MHVESPNDFSLALCKRRRPSDKRRCGMFEVHSCIHILIAYVVIRKLRRRQCSGPNVCQKAACGAVENVGMRAGGQIAGQSHTRRKKRLLDKNGGNGCCESDPYCIGYWVYSIRK